MSGGQSEEAKHVFELGRALYDPFLPGKNSKFSRYVSWFSNAQSTLPVLTDNDKLFPCALPFCEALAWGSRLKGKPTKTLWAKRWVNTLFAWFNFVTLGCPESVGAMSRRRVITWDGMSVAPLVSCWARLRRRHAVYSQS